MRTVWPDIDGGRLRAPYPNANLPTAPRHPTDARSGGLVSRALAAFTGEGSVRHRCEPGQAAPASHRLNDTSHRRRRPGDGTGRPGLGYSRAVMGSVSRVASQVP